MLNPFPPNMTHPLTLWKQAGTCVEATKSTPPYQSIGQVHVHQCPSAWENIETMDYTLKSLVNITVDINKGQSKVLSELRLMVLQNRMVLDMLTASQGGVCILIGTTCSTYISSENETHIEDAMNALIDLERAMSGDNQGTQWDFWTWLTTGPWWHWILKILSPIIVILIMLCLVAMCVFPCIKSMVNRVIGSAMLQYQLLRDAEPLEQETAFNKKIK